MRSIHWIFAIVLCLSPATVAQSLSASLEGTVTDPSGAVVPGAQVDLRGQGTARRASTGITGKFRFQPVVPGKYQFRVAAKGFTVVLMRDVEIQAARTLDIQLTIAASSQVVEVEDDTRKVDAGPSSNGGAIVLKEKELAALSDDPDELSRQLQAMAGPGGGPNGGQIYIDGLTGGNLPSKSSIREVRVNSNPFSPEYDRPGFGRIEIFTKPGTDAIHGQAFVMYNKEAFNSRSPLLAQSQRPPYKQNFFGFNISGPIRKQKASFGFDIQRRGTTENAFILATGLDTSLNRQTVNQAVLTPQTFTTLSPRADLALSTSHALTLRYQRTMSDQENQGAGGFNLATRAYNLNRGENSIQATETAIINPHLISETRLQFMRSHSSMSGGTRDLIIAVQNSFTSGGAQVGDSGSTTSNWELSNATTLTRGAHTIKWGGRLRAAGLTSTSQSNFWGTYTFLGGTGPQLDATNLAITGASLQLDALEVYRRTVLFQSAGLTDAQIRALGGGAYQFSMNAGSPSAFVRQFDAGLFANDDFKLRPNLTLSYGLRYETQTNIGDFANFAPRLGLAWGIDAKGGRGARTVLRAGAGLFYDRIAESLTLQSLRFNGRTQQSYVVFNPTFYPAVPDAATLSAGQQPQNLYFVDGAIQAARAFQASAGLERQINKYSRISFNYLTTRGTRIERERNINAPINGVYPLGDSQVRTLAESTGFSRTNQFTITPNVNYKSIFLFGFYALSYGKTDADGQPADPYNLRAEWGPSSYADIRHRFVMGTNIPLLLRFSISPFLILQSGSPYNITTGRDPNRTGVSAIRPALLANVSAAACTGADLVYKQGFGCFNLNPGAGAGTIERNSARGPGSVMLMLRLSRTWAFGGRRESDPNANGLPGPGGGGPPPGGGPGGGGPPPGGGPGGGGPPPGMGFNSGRRYTVTLGIHAMNASNHPNYAAPSGDLSSPYFGQYRSLAGGFGPIGAGSTYNRKLDVQLRFGF